MTRIATAIRDSVEATHFIDTHEHLPDEATRLAFQPIDGTRSWDRVIEHKVNDWSFLFGLYGCDDLCSAGLKTEAMMRFWRAEAPAEQKFEWIAPQWKNIRHTGYGRAIRYSLKILYGEDDLTHESAPRIAEKYRETCRPGFYDRVLREVARIDHCHVNSFTNPVFHVTDRPDLLRQDIDLTMLTDPGSLSQFNQQIGFEPASLEEWLYRIDEVFRTHGPQASAVKLQTAYTRNLFFPATDRRRADYAFRRCKANYNFGPEEKADLHNFLIRYTVEKATEASLPIKFHTGYCVRLTTYGDPTPTMSLGRVRNNQADLCRLYQDFPDARFVIFHMGYPYHHEVVAVAKHYQNVYVDMCWAWMLDWAESVQFLRSFLVTAPLHKIFSFGGDYYTVEIVTGHAHLARMGIAQALSSLVDENWIRMEEIPEVVEALMRGNAVAAFGDAAGH